MISYEIKAVLDEDTISNDDLNTFKLHMKGPELIGAAEAFRHYLKSQLKHCEPKNHDSLEVVLDRFEEEFYPLLGED